MICLLKYLRLINFKPENHSRAGFTLLEVLVVLLLVLVILGIASVFIANTLPSNKINATARDISTLLRQARTFAQMNGKIQTVKLNLDSKDFTLEGHKTRTIPPDVNIKVVDAFLGEIYTGEYIFTFYPNGIAKGGTIVLFTENKILNIEIDPVIGAMIAK